MTSALYLEHYLDGLESLPIELKRNFTLMRELDQRAQTVMQNIDEKAIELMKKTLNVKENLSDDEKKSRLKSIQEQFQRAKEFGDDKVQLAIQTYELVDKHIRRLDSDLARFEGEIQDKTITREKSEETVSKKGRKKQVKDVKVAGKKKRPASDDEEKVEEKSTQKSSKKQKVTQEKDARKSQKKNTEVEEVQAEGHFTPHPSDVLDMPVDPNEPTYCLCHQVSYGEMIGCDNNDCLIEWFHFSCVGLSSKPKGRWYCPRCKKKK